MTSFTFMEKCNHFEHFSDFPGCKHNSFKFCWTYWIKPINLHTRENKVIWHGACQYQVWRWNNNVYGRIAQYVYFVCTFTLLSSNVVLLLAFSSTNVCKCLRLMSNMKIGVPEHILCSLFQAHQSASVDSHSVPVLFYLLPHPLCSSLDWI